MRCIFLLTALFLVGCADPGPDIDRNQPRVTVGNGGSLHGGNATTIYADETVVSTSWGPSNDDRVEIVRNLPAGTYNKIRETALAQVDAIDQDAPPTPCVDYGTDYVTVYDALDDQRSIAAGCPDEAVRTAQNAVLQLYFDAIEEPAE